MEAKKNNKNHIEFAHKLNLIVSNSIKYVSGSTNTSTCSKDALKQKKGVCQDFAHILISAARFSQFPARYVNGFLLDETPQIVFLYMKHITLVFFVHSKNRLRFFVHSNLPVFCCTA